MGNKNDSTITDEVEDRLAYLFGESKKAPASKEADGDPEGSPLRDLKASVLSIDWEISDDIMTSFIKEIGRLKDTYKDDRVLLLFLRLLGSVGKYIRAKKANTHPGAIELFNSVYNGLENVLLSKGITQAEKNQALLVQVEKFRELKEQIASKKAGADRKIEVKQPEKTEPVVEEEGKYLGDKPEKEISEELPRSDVVPMIPYEAFTHALEEIKEVIKAEFQALRTQLKIL